jgi:neutral ceramidase
MLTHRWAKLTVAADAPTRLPKGVLPALLVLLALVVLTRPRSFAVPDLLSIATGLLGIGLCLLGVWWSARADGWAALARSVPAGARPSPTGLTLLSCLACIGALLLALAVRIPVVAGADRALGDLFSINRLPALENAMVWLTEYGGREMMGWAVGIMAAGLLLTRRGRALRVCVFTILAAFPLEFFLKTLISRMRPSSSQFADSFPSGHALAALLIAGCVVAAWVPGTRPKWPRGVLWILAVLWILPVGFSRIYLGRHHPADVLGGWLFGMAWLFAVWALYARVAVEGPRTADSAARGRVLRKAGAWAGGIVAALLLVVGPWPLDRTGYQGQDYQQRTLSHLAALAAPLAAGASSAALEAGFGERDISPEKGEPLAGYSKRWGLRCKGVRDRCMVRALALENGGKPVVLITGDILLIADGLAEVVAADLAKAHGLERSQVYFGATHTHSGPGGYGTHVLEAISLGPGKQEIFQRIRTAINDAAAEALGNLKPAEWSYLTGRAPEMLENRVKKTRPVDPELSVLSFRQAGRRIELVVFGAHATVLQPRNLQASGDYPGYLVRYLERKPGVKAMFLAGAVGSCSHAGLQKSRFREAEAYGNQLGDRVDTLLKDAAYRKEAVLGSLYSPIHLSAPQPRIARDFRLSPVASSLLLGGRRGNVQALALGDVLLLGAPGDINGELSLEIKAHARARGYRPVVTSFSGNYVGYMVPDEYYAKFKHMETELLSLYGPHNGAYVASVMQAATDRFPVPER